MIDEADQKLPKKRLNVLVDRTISDITPKKNLEFMLRHSNFSIGLQYATADAEDDSIESFGIVLEEEEGKIRE